MKLTTKDRAKRLIVLAGLAGSAHYLAVGVGTLVAGAIPEPERGALATVAALSTDEPDPCVLLADQAFDAALGAMDCEVTATPEAPPPIEGAELAECSDVPRRLVGTVVERGRPGSFAAIVDATGHASLLEEGGLSSGATVARIDPESVVLETPTSRCLLTLFTGEPSVSVATGAATPDVLASSVRPVSDTRARIDRATLDQLFADPTALLGMVRLIPHEEGGSVVGMRAYGVRSGSFVANLGLRNGDTLRSVNGVSVANTGVAFDALMQLRTARAIDVLVDRDGAPVTLHVDID